MHEFYLPLRPLYFQNDDDHNKKSSDLAARGLCSLCFYRVPMQNEFLRQTTCLQGQNSYDPLPWKSLKIEQIFICLGVVSAQSVFGESWFG